MNREEAISFLKQVEDILLHNNSWLESTHNPIKRSFDMAIEALKICDDCVWYKEKPHGEWIQQYKNDGKWHDMGYFDHMYKCSKCGSDGSKRWHFCPNCGANMRKEGGEE